MNQTLTSGKPCYSKSSSASQWSIDSDSLEYSTIDGNVITHVACEQAVNSGSGIFIGDYFVGLTENHFSLNHLPVLRY